MLPGPPLELRGARTSPRKPRGVVKLEESSRVAKVPFAESRRLFVVMESPSKSDKGRRRRRGSEKQGEVEGEGERLKDNRTSWMIWRWDERQVRAALSQVECDVNESNEDTKDSVQVCSILHVEHVYVRRVILVIVHYGLNDVEGVLVVIHTFT